MLVHGVWYVLKGNQVAGNIRSRLLFILGQF